MSKVSKIGIGIIIVLLIAAMALGVIMVSGEKIHSNITINGINVGGLTVPEAEKRLKAEFEPMIEESYINLKFRDSAWKLGYGEMKFQYDYADALTKAYNIGHKGNYLKRFIDVITTQLEREDIKLNFAYDSQAIDNKLSDISKSIDKEATDATITLKKEGFVITDESEGIKLDAGKSFELIKQQVEKVAAAEIELVVDVLQPQIKRVDLENIKDRLGEYSTKFNAADEDRTHNIKTATLSASNVLVKPGEIFSLNQTVGPRLAKFGYKEAKVIINNELVPGIGGGVCQVSSTLYNAALLSDMKIVERRSHSLPSSYVALGRDATISEDYIDLKFQNTTNYPIYIHGEVQGSWVKFSIYGRNDNPGRTVKIRTEVVKKTDPQIQIIEDPTLPLGTEVEEKKAYTGYVVKSYRTVLENGKEISTEELPLSVYRVANGVKRVGTMIVNPPQPSETENPTGENLNQNQQ
ncbi:MAG: VanW family protein [Caulobacteraceae bacterium]